MFAATVCVASCGGGGSGGGGEIGVTFTPGTLAQAFTASDSPSWNITVKFTEVPSQAVVQRLVDGGQAFGPQTLSATSSDGGLTWTGRISPKAGLLASSSPYTGTLTLQVCKDAACASQYALSGNVLPYTLTVAAPTGTCLPNSPSVSNGAYAVENNAYANTHLANPVGSYSQCVHISGGSSSAVDASWTWIWPTSGPDLHSYPEVEFGQKPWLTAPTTNAALPQQLSKLSSVTAHIDYAEKAISAGFTGYLVLDAYFASSMNFSSATGHVPVVAFLEVFLKSYGGEKWKESVKRTAHLGSCDWDVKTLDTADGWPLIGYFPASTCTLANPIDVDLMMFVHDYRQNEGHGIFDTDYFTSVEFGTQIFQGSGELDLNDYSVTVTAK